MAVSEERLQEIISQIMDLVGDDDDISGPDKEALLGFQMSLSEEEREVAEKIIDTMIDMLTASIIVDGIKLEIERRKLSRRNLN